MSPIHTSSALMRSSSPFRFTSAVGLTRSFRELMVRCASSSVKKPITALIATTTMMATASATPPERADKPAPKVNI